MSVTCPECKSDNTIKKGTNSSGTKLRYLCKDCSQRFSEDHYILKEIPKVEFSDLKRNISKENKRIDVTKEIQNIDFIEKRIPPFTLYNNIDVNLNKICEILNSITNLIFGDKKDIQLNPSEFNNIGTIKNLLLLRKYIVDINNKKEKITNDYYNHVLKDAHELFNESEFKNNAQNDKSIMSVVVELYHLVFGSSFVFESPKIKEFHNVTLLDEIYSELEDNKLETDEIIRKLIEIKTKLENFLEI